MAYQKQHKPPTGPRYWASWLGVALLWLLGRLPAGFGRFLVMPLGPLTYFLMRRRRKIAKRNIEKCFTDLGVEARQEMLRECFRSIARMLIETAWCWSAPLERLAAMTRVEGIEHLQDAEELGRGVLVLTFHSTCLEMGGFMMSSETRTAGIYRPLKNPVMEWYQNRGRRRYSGDLIKKKETRRAIRLLKDGGVLWYAPDQDFGRKQSEFAPFFGIPTATLVATHRFPRLCGCAVIPMFPRFDQASKQYVMTLLPALEDFPSDDIVADLTRVNAILEQQIRKVPGQYWWIHRRFKTRPEGEPPFYD